ncbi:hypothetical protein GH714_026457 [Hevea brasiliensis]|uniref:glutathione transferase n=1 Tax=Hevea brasiliensis TaxID=3981 RepID=A0A6A6N6Q7_HEVBR|nr:hypothetical protein GH714_026457 [Hevea brasiliensis]
MKISPTRVLFASVINPVHKKVPVLLHNEKPICESLVVLEYVDETWKQFPLLPQDPYERAKARFWAKFGDDKSIRFVLLTEGKEQQEATLIALQNLKYLEEELRGKKFFGGENIGLVDLALGWLAYYLEIYEEYVEENRVPPSLRQNPTLNQIRQHEDEVAKAPKALSYIMQLYQILFSPGYGL